MSVSEIRRQDDSVVSRWVCFTLAEQRYGLPIVKVQEVLREAEIEPVPGTCEQVLGVINLRGNVVTVLDLRARLGLPPQAGHGNEARVIVVEHGSESYGLMVDCVAEVRKVMDAAVKAAPEIGTRSSAPPIRGIYTRDGGLLTLLDADALIAGARFLS